MVAHKLPETRCRAGHCWRCPHCATRLAGVRPPISAAGDSHLRTAHRHARWSQPGEQVVARVQPRVSPKSCSRCWESQSHAFHTCSIRGERHGGRRAADAGSWAASGEMRGGGSNSAKGQTVGGRLCWCPSVAPRTAIQAITAANLRRAGGGGTVWAGVGRRVAANASLKENRPCVDVVLTMTALRSSERSRIERVPLEKTDPAGAPAAQGCLRSAD